jgi:hypothetical protein
MAKAPLVKIAVRIPRTFLKEARKLARRDGVNFSHFMRRTLAREFIARKDIQEVS